MLDFEWVRMWNRARQWCQDWQSFYSRERGGGKKKKCGQKSLSLLFPSPFVPLFPDIRTMAGLAFLLSCQRLHTKKFPLLAILHSIKSLTTILCMLGKIHKSINKVSFLQNLSKPLFRLFHLLCLFYTYHCYWYLIFW